MQAGELDQLIEVQAYTEQNDGGALVRSWESFAPKMMIWAKVFAQRGDTAFESARINAKATIRVKVRYRDDIHDHNRIVWMGEAYNIKYIDRSKRRDGELWLTAELNGAI